MLSETSDRSLLAELQLLAELPVAVRELVERSFTAVELQFGDVVFRQGHAPDAYYVLAAGSARVLVEGDDGQEVSLNVLRAGDAFGEGALLEGTPRTATVRASSPLRLLRLDRSVFQAIIDVYPDVAATLRASQRARQINDFLRLHSAFAVVPREMTIELIDHFDELELTEGEVAVRQGEDADALYLVQDGRLGVWIDDEHGEAQHVRTLHSGEFFGELALVQGSARTATVRAEGPVRLLRLSAAHFHRLMADSPAFAARVRERMALYDARDRLRPPQAADAEVPPVGASVWSAVDPGLSVTETGAEEEDLQPRRRRRFPFVRQIDEMDCGAACIAMLCRFYGHNVSMASIRSAVGTDVSGTTLSGLIRGGQEVGLRMRAIKSSADRIDVLPLPAVLHWGGNHWLIAHRVDGERVRVVDPARGPRAVSREQVAEKWSGYTALAAPTEALAAAPRGGLDLRWLGPFVRPYRRVLVIALVLSLIAAGFEMALPVFGQVIVDDVIGPRNEGLLYVLMAAMLGAPRRGYCRLLVRRDRGQFPPGAATFALTGSSCGPASGSVVPPAPVPRERNSGWPCGTQPDRAEPELPASSVPGAVDDHDQLAHTRNDGPLGHACLPRIDLVSPRVESPLASRLSASPRASNSVVARTNAHQHHGGRARSPPAGHGRPALTGARGPTPPLDDHPPR
jgi:CRP-like cAMP-binding protein/predicted double-glycine peptidase